MNTLSWKFPWDAAIPTTVSFPMTLTATIVADSVWVGLTFPGIIELPGSLDGMVISPRPQRGPLESQRMSLAIFIRSAAIALRAPWAYTKASLEERAWNLFGAVTKSWPVSLEIISAEALSKPSGALSPVPTAVPPRAISLSGFREALILSVLCSIMDLHPLISCPKVIGTAS